MIENKAIKIVKNHSLNKRIIKVLIMNIILNQIKFIIKIKIKNKKFKINNIKN